jgi:hypothetical protein
MVIERSVPDTETRHPFHCIFADVERGLELAAAINCLPSAFPALQSFDSGVQPSVPVLRFMHRSHLSGIYPH